MAAATTTNLEGVYSTLVDGLKGEGYDNKQAVDLFQSSFVAECRQCGATYTGGRIAASEVMSFMRGGGKALGLGAERGLEKGSCDQCGSRTFLLRWSDARSERAFYTVFPDRVEAHASSSSNAPPSPSAQPTSGCFVATACYGDPDAPEVRLLRRYRDRRLARSSFGRMAIRLYYAVSPSIAVWLAARPLPRAWVRRLLLRPLVLLLTRARR